MEFPTLISWCSPFLNQGLYDGIYNFYSDFNRTFYKKPCRPRSDAEEQSLTELIDEQ